MWSLLIGCAPGPGTNVSWVEVPLPDPLAPGTEAVGVAVTEADEVYLLTTHALVPVSGAEGEPFGQSAATDVVALTDDRFAVTVPGAGLRVDLGDGTSLPFFCYVPGWSQSTWEQLTDAVTYDRAANLLYAQPRTLVDGEVTTSSLASWDGSFGGEPVEWVDLPDKRFAAGAMAFDAGHLLAEDRVLWRTGTSLGDLDRYVDLASLVDDPIVGLALDTNDTLTVATRTGTVLRIDGWRPR
jgi:hypothetical protein